MVLSFLSIALPSFRPLSLTTVPVDFCAASETFSLMMMSLSLPIEKVRRLKVFSSAYTLST